MAQKPDADFAKAVIAELTDWQQRLTRGDLFDPQRPARGPAESLYFGGGTPSQLQPDDVASLIAAARAWPGLCDDAEITLEANPVDINLARCQAWRAAGINRLSIGVQSLDDAQLAFLGRLHSAQQAREAVATARAAGFTELSLDLIVATPEQSLAASRRDVQQCLALHPSHLSIYTLIIEDDTPLGRRVQAQEVKALDEDRAAEIFAQVIVDVEAAGLARYEISNFAKPGHEARHNRLYWTRAEYIGLGPSAHSLIYRGDSSHRQSNPASLSAYLKRFIDADERPWRDSDRVDELLPAWPAWLEYLAFGLRDLQRGVSLKPAPSAIPAQDLARVDALMQDLIARDLLRGQGPRLYLSQRGAELADAVAREILAL